MGQTLSSFQMRKPSHQMFNNLKYLIIPFSCYRAMHWINSKTPTIFLTSLHQLKKKKSCVTRQLEVFFKESIFILWEMWYHLQIWHELSPVSPCPNSTETPAFWYLFFYLRTANCWCLLFHCLTYMRSLPSDTSKRTGGRAMETGN